MPCADRREDERLLLHCLMPRPALHLPLPLPLPADVRSAAADALAEGADLHPEVLPNALTATVAMYSEQGGSLAARAGELLYCCTAALLYWQHTEAKCLAC
jgi:hypothetical protein